MSASGRKLTIALITSVIAASMAGCSIVTNLVQLRDVKLTGPNHQIPVRVTDRDVEDHLRITPNFSITKNRNIDGNVEIDQDSRLYNLAGYDTANNLHWNLPAYVVGIGFDYGLSKHLSFSLGGNYSRTKEKKSYEWDAGLGWCFHDKYVGGRFEVGLQWQDVAYSATFDQYEVVNSWGNPEEVRYLYSFNRYGKYMTGNFYGNLTLNTVFQGAALNGFVRLGYGVTSVLSNEMLRVNEEGDITTAVGMVNITPGLYINLTEWSRLVVGCEFLSPVSMNSYSPEWLIVPIAQVDFTL